MKSILKYLCIMTSYLLKACEALFKFLNKRWLVVVLSFLIISLFYIWVNAPSRQLSDLTYLQMESNVYNCCSVYNQVMEPDIAQLPKHLLKIPDMARHLSIYTYDDKDLISKNIATTGHWEGEILSQMDNLLKSNPNVHLLDIGCNLGVYSLVAAQRGRQVVAVDANKENIRRLRQSSILNQLHNRITLIHNALSDQRGTVYLRLVAGNIGGSPIVNEKLGVPVKAIYMDDLLEVINSLKIKHAIMKFDIEGKEYHALRHASKLFSQINITHVMMEWSTSRLEDTAVDVGAYISTFFKARGYRPFPSLRNDSKMLGDDFMRYPWDIVWKKM